MEPKTSGAKSDLLPASGSQGAMNLKAALRNLTAARGIIDACLRHRHQLVATVAYFAQIDVLNRVVRLVEGKRPARTVDPGSAHRGDHSIPRGEIATDGGKTNVKQRRTVEALYPINIAVLAGLGLEGLEERNVGGVIEIVGIMQRGLNTVGGLSLRLDGAVRKETRAVGRNGLVETRRRVVLDEFHR